MSLALALLTTVAPDASAAKANLKWSKRLPRYCEAPSTFYSSRHRAGIIPCCSVVPGMCEGGAVCPPSGVCAGSGKACSPTPPPLRPNIILMISDDQGDCHYGSAGECRSAQTGTAIPAPVTPNLDLLAGYGTVFPIAHNTASWCFPSLTSIFTGRYQRNIETPKPKDRFPTLPSSLRSLDNDPSLLDDPYSAGNKIGGYCTLLGGKLSPAVGAESFDARTRTGERVLGRTNCVAGPTGEPPRCGSESTPTYDPAKIFRLGDMFEFIDAMLYRVPNANPVTYAFQNFFIWYAPRIPHQPLRSPPPIRDYLFGSANYPLGGVFDLGSLCTGGSCPPTVTAFQEQNFGTVNEMYGNVWWVDDGLREIRKYLARASAPHCIDPNGAGRFDVGTPAACTGTWVENFSPDLTKNTIIAYLSDNGWHLPNSKHGFSENGYRTRLIIFDPRPLPQVPSWDPNQEVPPPAQESPALAHAVDLHATLVGFAKNTAGEQLCPEAAEGTRCDGRDLRPYLVTAEGGPAAPETLRHAICGHRTERATSATTTRYLLTRPGSIGRCTDNAAPSCVTTANCAAGQACVGGHCLSTLEPTCTTSATCPIGSACLGARCRSGPSCLADADCTALFPGRNTACVEKETKWCRNAPGVACTTAADCPACPLGGACGRLCENRQVKFYFNSIGTASVEMSDLFLDPDEVDLHNNHIGATSLTAELSKLTGPYGGLMRRANCCVDAWWPEAVPQAGTSCSGGCPAELTCNQ